MTAARRDPDLGAGRQPTGRRAWSASAVTGVGRLARARLRRATRPAPFPWGSPTWPGTVARPVPSSGLGDEYDTAWARRYPVRLARAMVTDNLTRPAVHLLASPLVRGAELLDMAEAPVVIVANHTSHLDTPLLLSVLPDRIRHRTVVAAAADHFFDRRWKAHLWAGLLGAIPLERNRVSRRSVDEATALVEDGWSLLIFPEGGRSPDGWQQELHRAASLPAARTGRPVIPVHLAGTHRILPKGGTRVRRARTTVVVGAPLYPEDGEDARHLSARLETALATLAAESRTDWWTARRQAAAGTTVQDARGPDASPWRRAWALGGTPAAWTGEHDSSSAHGDGDPRRWAVRRD